MSTGLVAKEDGSNLGCIVQKILQREPVIKQPVGETYF